MSVSEKIMIEIKESFKKLFGYNCDLADITIDKTPKNFNGFYTLIIYPHLKELKLKPEEIGKKMGEYLLTNSKIISDYNLVKGFLNFDLNANYLISLFSEIKKSKKWGFKSFTGEEVMIEFSSPNTNKPLHLGHLRNIFLGNSLSKILEANGQRVHKVQVINDRGIHICKSMVAWKLFSDGKTPKIEKVKGDKFVGEYYVKFELENKKQLDKLIEQGVLKEKAINMTPVMIEAKKLLQKWEKKDKETILLWNKMNSWVYEGFDKTYKKIGVEFNKNYYESETYLLGKKSVLEGLKNNIFYRETDNSVWVDLSEDNFDNKILLRSDGTSVYMTQDIGTAIKRFNDFPKITKQIYTVGSEQDYHFKVLFKILDKLSYKWANDCYHLSYGMIDLPDGKMKSREGKVVDADDLIENMIQTAKNRTNELGKSDDFEANDLSMLYEKIALGALKYYLLKVDSRKKMLFNPDESIDFQGNTGPFIQYTYARIRSIIRRSELLKINYNNVNLNKIYDLSLSIKKLINHIYIFPDIISQSSKTYSPSLLCQYVFDLAKLYNSFYQDEKIFDGENNETTSFKISLSDLTANTIKNSLELLGVGVPNKM